MGKKVFKSVLKVAAVAAIAYFAPPLAASVGGSLGISGALGTTLLSAGIGAGLGKLIPGVSTTSGLMAGGLGGLAQGAGPPTAAEPGFLEQATGGPLGAPGAGQASVAAGGGTAATGAATAPTGIGGALSNAAANPANVLTQGLRNMTGGLGALTGTAGAGGNILSVLGPQMIGGMIAGTPAGLKGISKAQRAELARAQAMNAAATQMRFDEAGNLIREANMIDPEYMARQAAEAAAIKGGILEREQTRGLTGERLAAEQRRYKLGTARNVGTAYQQGFGTGLEGRVKVRSAGISAIPQQYPTTSAEGALSAYRAGAEAKQQQAAAIGDVFGRALGTPTSTGGTAPSAGMRSMEDYGSLFGLA